VQDWVKHLLQQLSEPKHSNTIYAAKVRAKLEQDLKLWLHKLDPTQYVNYYLSKVYQQQQSAEPTANYAMTIDANI
jgi:hypothetical protein